MKQKKNKNHYIPASYPAGFSSEDSRKGLVWIFDKKEKKSYRNTCENTAYKKNYYKMDNNCIDEDFCENEFAKIEGNVKEIFRTISDLNFWAKYGNIYGHIP